MLVDSAAVGVEELVHGATGPMVAPCADQTARHQELPVGSTQYAGAYWTGTQMVITDDLGPDQEQAIGEFRDFLREHGEA